MIKGRTSGLQSSLSMQRLDRELSPERKRGSTEMLINDIQTIKAKEEKTKTTEQLLHDLTLNLDED